jgi:hypothetical protein
MDLKTKEWGMFFVDELHDIVWNEKAFDNLVLPEEDKALTWDFVEAKRLSNSTYDDFIADKGTLRLLLIPSLTEIGRGTIILMFGKPGVGKTLTAEAGSYPRLLRHAPNASSGRKVARAAVLRVRRRPRHDRPRRRDGAGPGAGSVPPVGRDPAPRRGGRVPRRAHQRRAVAERARVEYRSPFSSGWRETNAGQSSSRS